MIKLLKYAIDFMREQESEERKRGRALIWSSRERRRERVMVERETERGGGTLPAILGERGNNFLWDGC